MKPLLAEMMALDLKPDKPDHPFLKLGYRQPDERKRSLQLHLLHETISPSSLPSSRVAGMVKTFEELDFCSTPLGELVLRRRKIPMLENEVVYEIILNGEFLMSSLFHAVEDALADLGLAAAPAGPMDVVVGGLGLGYTAVAALRHQNVRSLFIVDFLEPVIRWHQTGLVPLGSRVSSDPRTRFIEGDFFALASHPETGFDATEPGRKFYAILLDIDHTPKHWLNERHASFYTLEGLKSLCLHLVPGGVFAMWSDEPPDSGFCSTLEGVFRRVRAHTVSFPNPIRGGESSGTVYVAVCQKEPKKSGLQISLPLLCQGEP